MRFRSLALTAALLALPSVAHANGRFPAANQLAIAPANPSQLLLRSTFGMLLSSDGGQTWDWICEKGVGYGGTQDPSVGIAAGGTFIVGTFEGLRLSTDTGCSWSGMPGPLTENVVVDLVVRPDTPTVALLLTNKFSGSNDAGALFASEVFASSDDGKSWNTLGPPLDPTVLLQTLEVSATDPRRIYASGARGSGVTAKGTLLVSTTGGASWIEREIPLDTTTETAPFICAVDPFNPDRLYVRTKGTAGSRLLVTDDAGKTFREVLKTTSDMLGFALSPDGQKAYAGTKDGLWIAKVATLSFSQNSHIAVQCLKTSGTKLYACSNELSGFALGVSEDDGATFAPLVHLYGIRGPLACSAESSQAQCVPDWPALEESLGAPPDAGQAGGDAPPSGGGGCRCDTSHGSLGHALGMATAALLVGLFFWRRRD